MSQIQPPAQSVSSQDWAHERGQKWCDQLAAMEATLDPVDAPLIDALDLDRPLRIAEIGCGGGGTLLKLLRHAQAGSSVHGIDISPALADRARARIARHEADAAIHVANAESAAAPEGPYDRLISRFGIMFFDDPQAAFSNLSSWLAPGGQIAFAVWGPPPQNPWMTSLREAVSQVMDVPDPDPDAPGPFRYAGGDKLLGLLKEAGLRDLNIRDWRGLIPLGGGVPPEPAVDFAFNAFSLGDLLVEADEAVTEEVRQRLTQCYAAHVQDGGVHMEACVHIVTGARSA
ncbi:MAG: class I SAM-dependent methyltransferase [Methyloceanibacter sp.]|nr:class I SAM-dependent methyltransferase [Methyloceanibacter sp.]